MPDIKTKSTFGTARIGRVRPDPKPEMPKGLAPTSPSRRH